MPPLDFPSPATPGQTYTSSGTEWIYDGAKWTGSTGTGGAFLPLSGGTVTGQTTFVGNTNAATTTTSFLFAHQSASGAYPTGTGNVALYAFNVDRDSVDATNAAGGGLTDTYFGNAISAGAKGGRTGISTLLVQTGATTLTPGQYYVASGAFSEASYPAGGVSGAPQGALFASNVGATLNSGAGYWVSCVGEEVDVGVQSGAAVQFKGGLTIVQLASDAVQGSLDDYAIGIGNQILGTAPGWKTGIEFGVYTGWWPFTPNSTLIGTKVSSASGGPAMQALNGVDFSAITFSNAFLKSTGFTVDGTGRVIVTATGANTPRSVQDHFADVSNVKDFGATGNGITDDTTSVNAAISAASVAGGGTVFFPIGTYLCNGPLIIPNNGAANNPTQNPIRLTGALGSPDSYLGNSTGGPSTPQGGTILDLRYGTTPDGTHLAKIDTRGAGILEIDRLTLADHGTSNYQFIFTTNTTLAIHDVVFRGNPANNGTACTQNAILLGGSSSTLNTNGPTSGFQGYGTRIKDCFFSNIKVAVGFNAAANAVYCENLTTDCTCGSSDAQGAPYVFYGAGGFGAQGNVISAGIVEMKNYPFAAAFLGTATNKLNCIIGQGLYDETMGSPTLGGYYFAANSVQNTILTGFVDNPIQNGPLMQGPGAAENAVFNGGGNTVMPLSATVGFGTGQAKLTIAGGNTNAGDGGYISFSGAGNIVGNYSAVYGGAYQTNLTLYSPQPVLIPTGGLGVGTGNSIAHGTIQAGDGTGARVIAAVGGATNAGDGAGFQVWNGPSQDGFFGNEDLYFGGAYLQRMLLMGYAGITFSTKGLAQNRIDNNGDWFDLTVAKAIPTTGQTVTLALGVQTLLIAPAGALAALTVALPAAAVNGMIKRFTITQAVTTLTVNATSGSVTNAPTSATAGQRFAFICYGADNAWYPT